MTEPTGGELVAGFGCLVALVLLAVVCAVVFSVSYAIGQALFAGVCPP